MVSSMLLCHAPSRAITNVCSWRGGWVASSDMSSPGSPAHLPWRQLRGFSLFNWLVRFPCSVMTICHAFFFSLPLLLVSLSLSLAFLFYSYFFPFLFVYLCVCVCEASCPSICPNLIDHRNVAFPSQSHFSFRLEVKGYLGVHRSRRLILIPVPSLELFFATSNNF